MAVYGPWHIDIRPWQSWLSTQGTWLRWQAATNLTGGVVYSGGSTGDNIAWDVPLTAGTWTLTTIYQGHVDGSGASTTVKFDSTTVGTISMGTAAVNSVSEIASITVAADGIVRLSYTAADAKVIRLQHIALSRTA